MPDGFPALDFDRFHRDVLPGWLAEGRGAMAAEHVTSLGALAFRRSEGGAFTYVPRDGGIDVVAGEESADTVIELDHATWEGIVHETESPAGLLYGGKLRCPRGQAMKLMGWEPALRTLYTGRPLYDAERVQLRDRRGEALDPESTFTLESDADDMAHFLRTAGYLFVRGVFAPAEVADFLDEASALAPEARKGDKLSWWGRNAAGEEILCRVTRAAAKPRLASIPGDPRMLRLKDLSHVALAHRRRESSEEGVSIIWKNPGMTEGLGDIPWHRDCGMGGHSLMCPVLIASVFLTAASPETGELKMLPGSWETACPSIDPSHPKAPRGASFRAAPGDVSLHYGDVMHAAPPPTAADHDVYRISAVTAYAQPETGRRNYNSVLHRSADGQIEHLSKVADQT